MATKPSDLYPLQTQAGDPEYPYGKAKNIVAPGDGTGTPWEEALVNDWLGFFQSLLIENGITPSGNPDRVGDSQYMRAMESMINDVMTKGLPAVVGDIVTGNVYTDNNAFVSNSAGGLSALQTSTNVDHFYHNDTDNAWHFVSDRALGSVGNSKLVAGAAQVNYIYENSSGAGVYVDNAHIKDGSFKAIGGQPNFSFYETDAPTGEKNLKWRMSGGHLMLSSYNDSDGFTGDLIQVERNGDNFALLDLHTSFVRIIPRGRINNSNYALLELDADDDGDSGIRFENNGILRGYLFNDYSRDQMRFYKYGTTGQAQNAIELAADRTTSLRKIQSLEGITFGQDVLEHYEDVLFTPTFAAAPTATVRHGVATRIGNKVTAHIRIEGTSAQRASISNSELLSVGNIPWVDELTDSRKSYVSVLERYGSYEYRAFGRMTSGFIDSNTDLINFWYDIETGCVPMTKGSWRGGSFYFDLHVSFICN